MGRRQAGTIQHLIVDRVLSLSFVAQVPRATQQNLVGQLQNLIHWHADLTERAAIVFPYCTYAYCSNRLGRP